MKVCLNNYIIINIVQLYGDDEINKIIKIQSMVRGMEMRDKIKLKSRNKKLLEPKAENKINNNVFIYAKKISEEISENDLELSESYEKRIVYIYI